MRKLLIIILVSASVMTSCASSKNNNEADIGNKSVPEYSTILEDPADDPPEQQKQESAKEEYGDRATEQEKEKTAENAKGELKKAKDKLQVNSTEVISPQLSGSAEFKNKIMQALDLLKSRAHEFYPLAADYLTEIKEGDHSGVLVETGVFTIGRNTYQNQDAIWLASIIIHDAVHVKLYQEGKVYHGKEGERKANTVQRAVLIELDAPQSYLDHLDKSLESSYWEVPYEQRQW